jgi:hypothetical protein
MSLILQLFESERFLFDHVILHDQEARKDNAAKLAYREVKTCRAPKPFAGIFEAIDINPRKLKETSKPLR